MYSRERLKAQIEASAVCQNFQSGDFLYGLQAVRSRYSDYFHNKLQEKHVVVDTINNDLLYKVVDEKFYYLSDAAKSFLEDPAAIPEFKEYLNFYQNVPDEKVRIQRGLPNRVRKYPDAESRKTRRCCKAVLLKPDITKHFLLDNIDINAVFNSQVPTDDYYSHTSAELRYVIKHWQQINPYQQNGVKFYYRGDEINNIFEWLAEQDAGMLKTVTTYMSAKEIDFKSFMVDGKSQTLDNFLEALAEKSTSSQLENVVNVTPKRGQVYCPSTTKSVIERGKKVGSGQSSKAACKLFDGSESRSCKRAREEASNQAHDFEVERKRMKRAPF